MAIARLELHPRRLGAVAGRGRRSQKFFTIVVITRCSATVEYWKQFWIDVHLVYSGTSTQYRDFVRETPDASNRRHLSYSRLTSARSASSAARSSALPGPLLDLARAACAASGSLTTCSPSLTEWLASQSRGVPAMVDGIIESSAR